MPNLRLTLAASDYDQIRDFTLGPVTAEGIDIAYLRYQVEEIFYRFTKFREWHVSEMSFGKYVSLVASGDAGITAIPVFPSRVFRQASIFVPAASALTTPEALAGKRVGIPEWAQTAGIYVRGWLAHQIGLDLAAIDWVQAGVNQPGRVEKVALALPKGVRVTPAPERSLSELLLSGAVDAVISAHPPAPFEDSSRRVRRLLADPRPVEEAYFRATGVFPIMHVIALRRDVMDRHPWVAMNLMTAFEEAKRRSLARVLEGTASRIPLPFAAYDAAAARALFGDDPWPYGIAPNRVTLEAFLQFAYEQGVCVRHLEPEELFPAELRETFKV